MSLTGYELLKKVSDGDITITPFNPKNINPNSYDLTLASKLLIYTDPILDVKRNSPTTEINIPEEGFVLRPGELYIGSVNEFTKADGFMGVLYGKSSLGRLGLMAHVCAGLVDSGYNGNLTLELVVTKPLRIYPDMRIAQIVYSREEGAPLAYQGKYQGDTKAQASKSFKDFK